MYAKVRCRQSLRFFGWMLCVWLLVIGSETIAQVIVPGQRSINVRVADAVYDRDADLIYVATKSTSSLYPQSVIIVNPSDLTVASVLPLPSVADILKLSEDRNYLYAVARTVPSVLYRIQTHPMRLETQYSLTYSKTGVESKIYDVLPIPGYAHRLAISFTDQYDNYMGAAAFDGTDRLPQTLGMEIKTSSLLRGPIPGLLYGYNRLSDDHALTRIRLTDTGLESIGKPLPGMAWGSDIQLTVSQGLLYAGNGTIVNVEAETQEGVFQGMDSARVFAIDEGKGVIYFAFYSSSMVIHFYAFDLHTFLPIAGLSFQTQWEFGSHFLRKLFLTNGGDLALFGSDSCLAFLQVAALERYESSTIPPIEQVTPHLRLLRAPAQFLTADPVNHRLYFTTSGSDAGIGNSVFSLDPSTGQVSSPLFVGSNPAYPAVSTGGSFLYLSLFGEGVVQRMRLPELIPDDKIKLRLVKPPNGFPDYGGFIQATQILPLPEKEESFAVVQGFAFGSYRSNYNSLAVYDGKVRRPKTLNYQQPYISSIAVSADGKQLYGLNNQTGGFDFSQISLTPEGPALSRSVMYIGQASGEELRCDQDWCLTSWGTILDPQQIARIGWLYRAGWQAIPDRARRRIYALDYHPKGRALTEYDADTMVPLRRGILPISGYVIDLVRWAPDGFAVLSHEGVWLISADVLAPIPPNPAPIVTAVGPHRQVNLPAAAIVYDGPRRLIYAAVPNVTAGDSIDANTVMALNPDTGLMIKSLALGSEPGPMDISDDGRYLYVGLKMGNAVVRIDLNRWERDRLYRMPGAPNFVKTRPGHADDFVTALGYGYKFEDRNNYFPFDPGAWLYRNGQRLPTPVLADTELKKAIFTGKDTLTVAGPFSYKMQSTIRITSNGLSKDPLPDFRTLDQYPMAIAGNRLFGLGGVISDPATLRFLEEVPEWRTVVPVPDQGRIYYLRRDGVRVYDWTTHRLLGFLPFDCSTVYDYDATYGEMIYCGPTCLAVQLEKSIALLDTNAIRWEKPEDKQPTRTADGVLRFPLRLTDMKFDAGRKLLYLTSSLWEGHLGNSVVPIDPSSGRILDPIYVGTYPTGLALTEDRSLLYVGIRGSRDIRVVDLQSRRVVDTIPVPQINPQDSYWVEGLAVRPGTKNVLGLTAYDGSGWPFWRAMMIGSDGKRMPSWVPTAHPEYVNGRIVFFTPSGDRLQIMGNESDGMWSLPVTDSGLLYEEKHGGSGAGATMARCNGLLFAADGNIYDEVTFQAKGRVDVPAFDYVTWADAVACDAVTDRLYYIRRNWGKLSLHTFRLSTRTLLESRALPQSSEMGRVARMESLENLGIAYWISDSPSYNGPDADRPLTDELVIVPGIGSAPGSKIDLPLSTGGASVVFLDGGGKALQSGYSFLAMKSGADPYGTAVFSYQSDGVTVSETGVPATPPTTQARVFIDYRFGADSVPGHLDAGKININTGIAVVNCGSQQASVTYTLRDADGHPIAAGSGTIAAGQHIAKFIDQLGEIAAGFALPADFQDKLGFASLEVSSSQPLSILALRMTTNQRNDILYTTTPVADLTQSPLADPIYFAQFADGGGYTSSLILLNTSSVTETGSLQILGSNGSPLIVNRVAGATDSSFPYSIPPGGFFFLRTDGAPMTAQVGWVRLIPDPGTLTPVSSGLFAYNPGNILVSESGVPSAVSMTHARVYIDMTGNHNTGLALANITGAVANILIQALHMDGITPIGVGPFFLPGLGHTAGFANEFARGLPQGFIGVLDIRSETPFAALTLRSLYNERQDFLMTTFPVADINRPAPSPIVFPHIVAGGGYKTQFILLSAGEAATTTLTFYDPRGTPTDFGN